MLIGYKSLGNEALIADEIFLQHMASRFVEADEDLIEELKHGSENKNTTRSKLYFGPAFSSNWL